MTGAVSDHALARLSPDAYIQMAMQLAWYRTQGSFTATYETALTRMFKNGRTETIRTLTAESREWVLAMMNPATPVRNIDSVEILYELSGGYYRCTSYATSCGKPSRPIQA